MKAGYRAQDRDGRIFDYENHPALGTWGWHGNCRFFGFGITNPNWKTACFDLSEGEPVIIDGILCAPGKPISGPIYGDVGTGSIAYKMGEIAANAVHKTNRTPEQFDEHLQANSCTGHGEKQSTIADKAKEIIYGDRESTYGDPGKNLNVIASMWSTYTGAEITAQDVCNMMILLKLSRLKNTPEHEDSLIDIIGYTLLKERIK